MIEIYTDGACVPNPGEMAIGIVLLYKDKKKEISKKLGKGTNQVAELTAVNDALCALTRKDIPITIYTDSQYAINCLSGNWNCQKNKQLIEGIKKIVAEFDIEFKWVRGHNGNKYNERADYLANSHLPDWKYK